MRDILRTAVLRTNPYWPFTHCNRWPYYAAMRALQAAVRSRPEIRSVYARNGFANGTWIPGSSDIDLTIVLRPGLSAGEEFHKIDAFRASLRRLQAAFPVLEPDTLSACDFPLWLNATSQRSGPSSSILLYGEADPGLEIAGSPHWRVRALDVALWVYTDPLPPCLAKPSSFLRAHDIARRVRKIVRTVEPVIEEGFLDVGVSMPSLVSRATKMLELATARVEPALSMSDGAGASLYEAGSNRGVTNANSAAPPGVIGVIRRRADVITVIEDGLSLERIAEIFDQSTRWGTPQLVFPASVFRYWLRYYDPYEYSRLFRERVITAGRDPLDGFPPPGTIEFGSYWHRRLDNILTSVRGDEVFCRPGSFSMARFHSKVVRAMALRMVLKKNRVFPELNQIDASWRSEYPDVAGIFEELRTDVANGRESAARLKAFTLLRSCADEIRDRLPGEKASCA